MILAVNKIDAADDIEDNLAAYERYQSISNFSPHSFGFGKPLLISASHGTGVGDLLDACLEQLPKDKMLSLEEEEKQINQAKLPNTPGSIRVAIVGQPNAGKSSLVNRYVLHLD